jgi:hypothetical protein
MKHYYPGGKVAQENRKFIEVARKTADLMTWTTLMPIFHRRWDNGGVKFSEGDPCHGKVH